MAAVTIIVKGIAMSYYKNDGLWRVLFPFGECHVIKFKENENDKGIELAEKNRNIRITTEGAGSKFEIGANYNDFLDLTAGYSHSKGVKMKDGWQNDAVLMTVENAEYSVDEYTTSEHLMVRNHKVTMEPQNIAYSSKITIEAEKVIVNVDGHDDFPKIFDKDTTIIFDNDCEKGQYREVSDLEMVYNVVEDFNNAGEQCLVAKVSANGNPLPRIGDFYGDPKDSYLGGLPCHGVIVSKTDNLP